MHNGLTTIETIEAIEAIKTLKHRYWRACDCLDPDGFRSAFIRRGADIDYGPELGNQEDVEPIEQFVALAQRKVEGRYNTLDMHHGFMPEIVVVSPTEAIGTWALLFRRVDLEAGTDTSASGEYDDRYVIEDGIWKMAKCHFRPFWSITRLLVDTDLVVQMPG